MFLSKLFYFRILLTVALALTTLFSDGCNIFKKNQKVPVRSLFENGDIESLKKEINRFAEIKSLGSKIYIEFEDNTFAESGIAEKYKRADGEIIVQRPASIYFTVKVPFVGTDIAQMTSDGEKFRVAVIYGVEEKYKKFVSGRNNANYSNLREKIKEQKGMDSAEKKSISAFASLRPQHFTDALLMRPIRPKEDNFIYVQSEFEQEETDNSGKKLAAAARLIRGYYFLDELKVSSDGNAQITRRFWFNRIAKINLSRQQIFDEEGRLITDISYGAEGNIGEQGEIMPIEVTVTRPQEKYKVKLTYQSPETVVVGKEYQPKVFNLENRWNLAEVDLDTQKPE